MALNCNDIICIFEQEFFVSQNVRLIGGAAEPLYQPANIECDIYGACEFNRIWFRHDYVASALHEIAHWCVAGEKRLALLDWGYWYTPDDRTLSQQKAFEKVEAKNQALEWIFNRAAGFHFQVSVDNLNSDAHEINSEGENGIDRDAYFKDRVYASLQYFIDVGLPARAMQFFQELNNTSGSNIRLKQAFFSRSDLNQRTLGSN